MLQKPLFTWSKLLLVGGLTTGIVGCDQITKVLIRSSLNTIDSMDFLGGLVHLQRAENTGAFLSLGAGWPEPLRWLIFQFGVFGSLALTAWLLWRQRGTFMSNVGFTLILAGGIGNLIDRLWKGSVTDFMVMGWGPLHTGVFNVADVAIVVGLIVIVIPEKRAFTQKKM